MTGTTESRKIAAEVAVRDYRKARKSLATITPLWAASEHVLRCKQRENRPQVRSHSTVRHALSSRDFVLESARRLAPSGEFLATTTIARETGIPVKTVFCCICAMRKESPSPWIWAAKDVRSESASPVRDGILAIARETPEGGSISLMAIKSRAMAELRCSRESVTNSIRKLREMGLWKWEVIRQKGGNRRKNAGDAGRKRDD